MSFHSNLYMFIFYYDVNYDNFKVILCLPFKCLDICLSKIIDKFIYHYLLYKFNI